MQVRAPHVLLRLPLEVAPLFRDWLDTHHPDRAAHVMSTIQQLRGGKDYDSQFGTHAWPGRVCRSVEQPLQAGRESVWASMQNSHWPKLDCSRFRSRCRRRRIRRRKSVLSPSVEHGSTHIG
jgi:DNA repair photolyase